jgi:hypothetical protein
MDPDTTPAEPPLFLSRRGWIIFAIVLVVGCVLTVAITRYLSAQPPSDGGRYATPENLVAAMERDGVVCSGYSTTENPTGAVGRGSCQLDGQETVVSIYATESDAKGEPERKNRLLGGLVVDMVVGVNWTVSCHDPAAAKRVADAIGGQVVHLDKPTG